MSLYKRRFLLKDGSNSWTWAYDFLIRGRRYRGSFGKLPATTAKALYARERTNALEGYWHVTVTEAPTVRAFVPEFLTWYQTQAAPSSVARYRSAAQWIVPAFGSHRLSELTDQMIDRYVQARREAGRMPVTVNREVGFLRHLLVTAVRWQRVGSMPLSRWRPLRELGHERILSPDEEARLLQACGDPLRGMVMVALDTGFRESELIALRRPMVNLRHALLTVPNAYAKIRETRSVEMTSRVRAVVAWRLDALDGADVTTPLLGYRSTKSAQRAFRRACQHTGLAGVRFHDLRHTFATRLLLAGVPVVKVQALLGHKTITMTMRYVKLTEGDMRGVIQVLDRVEIPTGFPTMMKTPTRPTRPPQD